jgi:glycosyltransferase involved in cell wall biosynthesis
VKRCDLLLCAAARLAARGLAFDLLIAGDGPERKPLEKQARTLGLDRVRFLGSLPTNKLPELYAAADIFVLPSDHEPWGAVTCEAAACRLPLVLSDRVGAAPDVLEDGVSGHLFPAGDEEALAGALERLLEDPAKRRRMGAMSALRVRDFTHGVSERRFMDALHRALGG